MKREAIVILFLLLLFLLSLGNLSSIHRWNAEISSHVAQCGSDAEAENFPASRSHWEKAFALWQERQTYAGLVLPHAEIDGIYDGFYELKELLEEESRAAAAAAEKLCRRLRDMEAMESLKPGTVFCTIYR